MIANIHNEWFIPLERTGLILKQAEWNIIQMGNDKFLNKCKRVHFHNIAIESKAGNRKFYMLHLTVWSSFPNPDKDIVPAQSIPIMTNSVVNADMQLHVDYGTVEIQSYRSLTHDVIKIYGFRFKNTETGKVKGTFRIEDGLRKGVVLLQFQTIFFTTSLPFKSSLIKVTGLFSQIV